MRDKKLIKTAEKIIKEFFKKTTFEVDFGIKQDEENTLSVGLKMPEPQILIGEKGKTLTEIQMLLGRMVRRQTDELVYLDLDINDYKKNKAQYLREIANSTADAVSLEKTEKMLFPMTSFERRVVHLELAERGDVKTESSGEEPYRKVVIKPA